MYTDANRVYERPPHVAHFHIKNSDLPLSFFSMINLHLKPANVLAESLELRNVIDEILVRSKNVLVMGDMNFDCRYMSSAKKEVVRLALPEFDWYINDDVSTTTSAANCALDRILMTGDLLKEAVIQGSNQTYLYFKEFNMTLEEVSKSK